MRALQPLPCGRPSFAQLTVAAGKPDCRYSHPAVGGGPARVAPPTEEVRLVRGADGALELASAKPPAKESETQDKKRRRHHKEKKSHREEKESRHGERKKEKHRKHSRRERSTSDSSGGRAERADSESEASLLPPGAPPPPLLTQDDYFLRNIEFCFWLRREGKGYFTELSSTEARRLFVDFCGAWNARSLPRKVYAGEVTISGRR